jgi:signal transduction histidine kinase
MRLASTLTNRIFLASTALSTLSLGLAFVLVDLRASAQVEADLERGVSEAATLVDQHRATLTGNVTRMARLLADLPKLKALVETFHAPTVQGPAEEYLAQIEADLLVVTGPDGQVLGAAGERLDALPISTASVSSLDEMPAIVPHPRGVLQVVSVPIIRIVNADEVDVLGRLTVGVFMDDELAAQFRDLTGSDIAFAAGGRVLASSLPPSSRAALERLVAARGPQEVRLGEAQYLALARPMAETDPDGAVTVVLRSKEASLAFLDSLRYGLGAALLASLLLATLLSYLVARTMTRPLGAVTHAMREVAATGDLTRKVSLQSGVWDDEDARLLAASFNTLTESIARFQRDAALKERLSALGRLSTVIAHEIRNPLMIIRASLAALRGGRVEDAEVQEAIADIDEETSRLNRLVGDVLDFARPLRFELAEARLNDVCRASAEAAWADREGTVVRLDLDERVPPIVTDAELLRRALVNVLTNARHAVEAAGVPVNGAATDSPILLSTRRDDSRVVVTVRDRGTGIAEEHLGHIFDPYFTTRRTGTGLGLPITKNIVEGLGGTLAVSSRQGEGTEVRIELPVRLPGRT